MVAERFRALWSNSSSSPLKDPGSNPAWGRELAVTPSQWAIVIKSGDSHNQSLP